MKSSSTTLRFIKVFCRDLQGRYENAVFLNADHMVKIEPTSYERNEVSSIITMTTGERIEVAGMPEDLLTHDRYFFPKAKEE